MRMQRNARGDGDAGNESCGVAPAGGRRDSACHEDFAGAAREAGTRAVNVDEMEIVWCREQRAERGSLTCRREAASRFSGVPSAVARIGAEAILSSR